MDPTANYAEQIRLAKMMRNCDEHDHAHECHCLEDEDRLVELVLALNDWIQGGGHLPKQFDPR